MSAASPPPGGGLGERLARLLGSPPRAARRVERGYAPADRWLVALEDGRDVFVKAAVSTETSAWLGVEEVVYRAVRAPVVPRRIAFDAGPPAVLVLEDLSGARWPPPWGARDADAVREALDVLHAATPPPGLPALADGRDALRGWARVAQDPAPFLSLGLADAAWLRAALPPLRRAEGDAVLAGTALLHQDVRSDNLCFAPDGPRLVDWNWAAVGNPDADLAFWLPSLAAEGGPVPEALWRGGPEWPALVAGWFASSAGLPPPRPGSRVREVQRLQLGTAFPWAVRALGLPRP